MKTGKRNDKPRLYIPIKAIQIPETSIILETAKAELEKHFFGALFVLDGKYYWIDGENHFVVVGT